MVDALISNADLVMADLEKSVEDRLVSGRNQSTSLQGQIDLLRSHQAIQDRRINFAFCKVILIYNEWVSCKT